MTRTLESPKLTIIRRGTYGGGLPVSQDTPGSGLPAQLLESDNQRQSWWRRFRNPSPYWMLPVLFFPGWTLMGPLAVFQHIAKDFYGLDAELYYNISIGIKGFIAVITGPLVGALSDRWGRKPLLVFQAVCTCIPGICLVAFNLCGSGARYGIYLSIYAASGITGSTFTVIFAYISDTTSPEQRTKIMGVIMGFGLSLAGIGSPIFWAYIDQHFGLHNFLMLYAAFWIAYVLLVLVVPESLPRRSRSSLPPLSLQELNPFRYFRALFHTENPVMLSNGRTVTNALRVVFGVVFFLYVSKMGFLISLGLYAQTTMGFTQMQASFLVVTYNITVFCTQNLLFAILRVSSHRIVCALGVSAGVVAGVIVSIPNISGSFLYVAYVPLATSFVTFTVGSSIVCKVVPPEQVGEATGLLTTALSFCEGLGPLLFGTLTKLFQATSYPQGGFLIFTFVMVGGVVLSFILPSDTVIEERCEDIKAETERSSVTKKVPPACATPTTMASSTTSPSVGNGLSPSVSEGPLLEESVGNLAS